MDEMAERWADRAVSSVFIYTREAHPGEHYPHHDSMSRKREHARAFHDLTGLRRPLLVDSLDGKVHRAWGLMPNMTWIVAQGGLVVYKGAWTGPEDIEECLQQWLKGWQERRQRPQAPFYTERLSWRARDEEAFNDGLRRAGQRALDEFYETLPAHHPDRAGRSKEKGQ